MESVKPKVFVLDVDGVLSTGQFFYGTEGKAYKVFGADDNDALALLKPFLEVRFVTGDQRGFEISRKRIEVDMKYELDLVSTVHRSEWIGNIYGLSDVIYMGDGIFDHYVMKKVGYSLAPDNAHPYAKKVANFVTSCKGGEGAVAEACLHILDKFFEPFSVDQKPKQNQIILGETTV